MDSFETSIIPRVASLENGGNPLIHVHIKEEVIVQDVYIKEEIEKEEGNVVDNDFLKIKVEVLEDTNRRDDVKLEDNIDKSYSNQFVLGSNLNKNQKDFGPTEINSATLLQSQVEEEGNLNPIKQSNTDSFVLLPCSINLHNGVNLNDIFKCKICKKLKYDQRQFTKDQTTSNILTSQEIFDLQINAANDDLQKTKCRKIQYKCNQCGLKFLSEHNLRKHYLNHNTETESIEQNHLPYTCEQCGLKFLLLSNLTKHYQSHNLALLTPSQFVGGENHNLNSHTSDDISQLDTKVTDSLVPVQPSNKQHQCVYCGLQFILRYNLTKHLKVHSNEPTHKCLECDKIFNDHRSLKIHSRFHLRNEPYKCSKCEKTFVRENLLKDHEKFHSGEMLHNCNECGKTFLSQTALKAHSRRHTSAHKYKCTYCNKTFVDAKTLSGHIGLHLNDIPYKCNECGKEFALKSYADRHYRRSHEKERPYQCDECGKNFAQYFSLKLHSRIHQNEKPWECSDCSKKFSDKYSLARHIKIHLPQKPFTSED